MRQFGAPLVVPVGTIFRNRQALRDAGVHAPLMAGISGTQAEGADSIVVSGGYADDADYGDVIIYTGHGGNDPASKQQIADQDIAAHGNAGLITSQLEGLPVRVVRGAGGHSEHAPASGFRYDGLYRVTDHWLKTGVHGFKIVQFRLERIEDQPEVPVDQLDLDGQPVALRTTVVGRVSPEDKRRFVQALVDAGRYVAMIGDGVNDVPALKASRLAIAQGAGAQMARSVADLVLVRGSFAAVVPMVEQGRQALRNLQRVAKLYVTKSALAAFLILLIGTTSTAYPLLPRHFSLAATLTIGVPTFFLALTPSSGPWRTPSFTREVARFAVPAGSIIGAGVLASYLFALHALALPLIQARTVAITVLIVLGLYLIIVLEAVGMRRRTIVSLAVAALAGVYLAALLIPPVRHFFLLAAPTIAIVATAICGSLISLFALVLSGYTPGAAAVLGPADTPGSDETSHDGSHPDDAPARAATSSSA